jgi:predicted Ser/Thr protein kinase
MIGLGWMEILVLLACTGVFFLSPVVVAIVFFATARARRGESGGTRLPAQPAPVQSPAPYDASATSIDLVARLTQRFCPQCRSPLAADAPEGLCPACLMAGALVSRLDVPEPGMVATTPPSGSQPPAAGEWSDLAARFPQLEILELLGRGGMGTVYKARQRNLDRIIALKVIPPDAAKDPAFAERFGREARAMARMNHPNIVTVYDFGHTGDVYWLMMEYVDGVNLRHALRAGHLQPREALAIVPQVCDALQYAHDQGVVHRDIKPENVLLDRSGRVKIADFGLAKLLGKGPDDFTLTRTQQVMGTPRYMAPEQIERPTTVDHRADIYSLGVVLYEMLTGELPMGRFDPPSHKVQVDVRIDQVVLRALEKAPERRYQRASEIKTDLASSVNWAAPAAGSATLSAPTPLAWHTPAPASKDSPTEYPSFPGGVPLAQVLIVAFGMVLGVLLMAAGLALVVYGVIYSFQPGLNAAIVWSWWGAGFGCLVGGFGSASGSYNTYRQMAGAEDLLRSPRTTWFDWVMRAYLAIGIALWMWGAALADGANSWAPFVTLGSIATFQAGLFLLLRMLMRGPIKALELKQASEMRRVTPAPASKDAPTAYPSISGGVPLALGLMVAFGMVLGVLLMGAGPAMAVLALGGVLPDPGGWLVAALGCAAVGVGSATWSYNTYRQMAGAIDLLRSPRVTWFDWVMRVYLVVGVALLILGSALVGGGNFKNAQIILTLGGIPAIQAGLFLILRLMMRSSANHGIALASRSEDNVPAEPGYLRAVVLPTLALAGVFAILLADVYFAMPPQDGSTSLTSKVEVYRRWQETLLLGAVLVVPSCLMALAVWRTGGPCQQDSAGRWVVSFPFGHRAWLWAIAGLAALSLLLPWFRLEVLPESQVEFRFEEVFPVPRSEFGIVATQEKADGIRTIAAIPITGRYSLRGLQAGQTAAAACLVIFAAILSALVFEPRHPARICFLIVGAAVSLILVTTMLHKAADQRPDIVADETAEDGLFRLATQSRGLRPATVEPWRHAISQGIVARPAFGLMTLLAACGLAILVGTTELCWGGVPAGGSGAAPAKPVTVSQPLDPAREKLRTKVAGPAIGLIVAGLLGLTPLCLVLLAVPAFTLTPMQKHDSFSPRPTEQFDLPVPGPIRPGPPTSMIPLVMSQSPAAAMALRIAMVVPPLAAEALSLALADGERSNQSMVALWLPVAAVLLLLNLAHSVTLIIGGWQMRKLRSYGLAFVAAVLAVLPCTFAWVVGLPMGIWALFVLMDPEVKAGFES